MAQDEAIERSALQTPSLTVAALIVAAGFLGSRLLGLVRSVIIAHSFGTSAELDAYWVAFRLPDLVFQLLAGATLASAFIPSFAGVRARQGEAAAWRLASSVLNIVLLATLALAVVAFIAAPLIVPLMAPGLGEGTGREEEIRGLAVDLTRIMLVSPVLFAVSGMFMGILNARRHFLTPALAPMFYNLSMIVAALVSSDVRVLAAGVVAGALLHLLVQLPDLRLAGMAYKFVADWRDRAVREVGALMAPRVLGLAAAQVNFYFIGIFFASQLDSGAISALTFAWLIVMTPLGVIGMSISTAAFPTMADQAARDTTAMARTLAGTLRLILYLSLPAGAGLMLLAKPLVVVMLEHGAFTSESSTWTAGALFFYAAAIAAHGGVEILSRGYYVLGDTRTPVAIAIGSMLTNLALAAALVGPLEVEGLALAVSIAAAIEFVVLLLILGRRVDGLVSPELALGAGRMLLATGVMAAVVAGLVAILHAAGLQRHDTGDALAVLAAGGASGALAYLVTSLALGLEEPGQIANRLPFLRRLLSKPGR